MLIHDLKVSLYSITCLIIYNVKRSCAY